MTLCVKDEGDVLDAQLAFHLNAGVDFVVATDTGSSDETVEILERYERAGKLELRHDHSQPFDLARQRTIMARAAASDHGADWVINSDGDEFWWPRGYDLKTVFGALPPRYGVVFGLWRPFVPRPAGDAPFYERMTVRLAPEHPINDPTSKFRPNTKVAHRADPDVAVGRGNHTHVGTRHVPLRGWYPIEVLHFPFRDLEQAALKHRKADAHAAGKQRSGYFQRWSVAPGDEPDESEFAGLLVDDEELAKGLAAGVLVEDIRLRDALRSLSDPATESFRLPDGDTPGLDLRPPSLVDDARYAADVAVLDDANLVRTQRRLDELERRLRELERNPALRASRSVRSLAQRVRRPRT